MKNLNERVELGEKELKELLKKGKELKSIIDDFDEKLDEISTLKSEKEWL